MERHDYNIDPDAEPGSVVPGKGRWKKRFKSMKNFTRRTLGAATALGSVAAAAPRAALHVAKGLSPKVGAKLGASKGLALATAAAAHIPAAPVVLPAIAGAVALKAFAPDIKDTWKAGKEWTSARRASKEAERNENYGRRIRNNHMPTRYADVGDAAANRGASSNVSWREWLASRNGNRKGNRKGNRNKFGYGHNGTDDFR